MVRFAVLLCLSLPCLLRAQNAVVLQTDFGTSDGAVASMKGVAHGVASDLHIYDLTHEIPPYDIWQAAYRLYQTAEYWPAGTVFVSVVDPGVGTNRKSVVLQTKSGHFFVSPDNGTLTLVAEHLGIEAVREIDEVVNRRQGSEQSHTFHGRDVYAFTGARLASGRIKFQEVGPLLGKEVKRISYQKADYVDGKVMGNIPILDDRYGNVWTNIPQAVFEKLGAEKSETLRVIVKRKGNVLFDAKVRYFNTFGDVPVGQPLLYLNSLGNLSLAINQDNFAEKYGVAAGAIWQVEVSKVTN